MNGMVVQAFGAFVAEKCSPKAKGELAKRMEGVQVLATLDCPDRTVTEAIGAVAVSEGIPVSELFERFGEYFIQWTTPRYRMAYAAPSARDFLIAMGTVHTSCRNMCKTASPPEFVYEMPSSQQLVMVYRSPRRLCQLMRGLFKGVAAHYKETIQVHEPRCMLKGAAECRFELTFGR